MVQSFRLSSSQQIEKSKEMLMYEEKKKENAQVIDLSKFPDNQII
jgi:hypothetical protein